MAKSRSNQNLYLVLLAIVIAVVLVIVTYIQRFSWENSDARAYLSVAISKWGNPAHLSKKKGGIAIWTKEQLKEHHTDNSLRDLLQLVNDDYVNAIKQLGGRLSANPYNYQFKIEPL